MINVTFQFDSIEAAQDFLDDVKIGDAAQGRRRPQVETFTAAADAAPRKERKPRSDAGQPRGPYKRKDELPVEAAAPATVPAETPPAAPEAAAPVAEAPQSDPTPTALALADVRAAMTGRSTEKNIALLKKFGYAKSSDLPQAKYAEFIAACKRGE